MISFSLYIIDDEQSIREGLELSLGEKYSIETFARGNEGLAAVTANPPDLILLDIGLPDINGIVLLEKIKSVAPQTPVIMITAYEDYNNVIGAMKNGAYDYLLKPIQVDALEAAIGNALEMVSLKKEVQALRENYINDNFPFFIGGGNAMETAIAYINSVAQSPDTPVLIVGETGSGKEMIAKMLHYRGPNFKGPFVAFNSSAIPNDLVESELFGYEKGAFSGASASGKKGLVEEADNGSLFLDEIGDMSLEVQAKLLRFLDSGEFYRVGGTKKCCISTKVISATNKNLEEMVEKETFRRDLLFRLGVVKIEVPSLNERREEIVEMAKYFLADYAEKFGKTFTGFTKQAEERLVNHKWTGNVRELKNRIERGTLISKGGELTVEDLGFPESAPAPAQIDQNNAPGPRPLLDENGIDISNELTKVERAYFERAMELAGGNESQAARLLNLNHHTFRYRRKKLIDSD